MNLNGLKWPSHIDKNLNELKLPCHIDLVTFPPAFTLHVLVQARKNENKPNWK